MWKCTAISAILILVIVHLVQRVAIFVLPVHNTYNEWKELLHYEGLYYLVKKKNDESDNKLICILALVGGALVVALIAYAVYRFLTPDYFEDYDDDDFDDDFDDEWDDDEEDEEEAAEEAAEEPAEEAAEEETTEEEE